MNKSGFTWMEVMVIVAILALLSAIAIPSFLKTKEHAELKALGYSNDEISYMMNNDVDTKALREAKNADYLIPSSGGMTPRERAKQKHTRNVGSVSPELPSNYRVSILSDLKLKEGEEVEFGGNYYQLLSINNCDYILFNNKTLTHAGICGNVLHKMDK